MRIKGCTVLADVYSTVGGLATSGTDAREGKEEEEEKGEEEDEGGEEKEKEKGEDDKYELLLLLPVVARE
jgi:ribosomal protein L12E/L44/L45/RPP1/RPP2